jgi:hypothetical protein
MTKNNWEATISIGRNNTGQIAVGPGSIVQTMNANKVEPDATADPPATYFPTEQEVWLQRLREQMIQRFNQSELRDLSFKLNINYEMLNGDNLQDKVSELILHLVRQDRLEELVAALTAVRPNEQWQQE